MQQVRCPHCGSSNPSTYRRCESCHQTYDPKNIGAPMSTTPDQGVSYNPPPTVEDGGSGTNAGVPAIGICLICAGVASIVYGGRTGITIAVPLICYGLGMLFR